MKNFYICFLLSGILACVIQTEVFAGSINKQSVNIKASENITGSVDENTIQLSADYKAIKDFLTNYTKVINAHDAQGLDKLYAKGYKSADGINKANFMELIKKTWENYPDIKYDSKIISVKVNDMYATVHTVESLSATTKTKSELTNDNGVLSSSSETVLYLQKIGKNWKMASDRILSEKTFLCYGKAKGLSIEFSAPEQVYSDEVYTASLYIDIPDGMIAIGSINREPIVYPEVESDEVFRQIPPVEGILERLMKANNTNNNELAVASIGYTELERDIYQKPNMKISGVALLMQRVNVVPKSTYLHQDKNTLKDNNDIDDNVEDFDTESQDEN
jgi:hypothetical protein